jgi:hypothetical protein
MMKRNVDYYFNKFLEHFEKEFEGMMDPSYYTEALSAVWKRCVFGTNNPIEIATKELEHTMKIINYHESGGHVGKTVLASRICPKCAEEVV